MSELAELMLLIVAVLPALAGAAAAIPGAWWPEARRFWFATFACAAAGLAAAVVASSPLWGTDELASTITTGAWSPSGSPIEIVCRLSIDPTRAEFLGVLMLASLAVSIALPHIASLRGQQRRAVASLLATVSCASFAILATNLLLKAIALSFAAFLPLWLADGPRAAAPPDPSSADAASSAGTETPRPVILTLADAALYFVLLIGATTIGTLEEPSGGASSVTTVLGEQVREEHSTAERAEARAMASLLALGLLAAIAVRLSLFPLLGGAVDASTPPLTQSLFVATSVPAAVALLVASRPLFELAPGMQRVLLFSAAATVLLSAWRSVIAPGRRRTVRALLSSAGGAVVCIALFADPLATPIAALVLGVACVWGASRLMRFSEPEPATGIRSERPPRARRQSLWSPLASLTHPGKGIAAPLESGWRTSIAILLGTGRNATTAFLFGIRKLHAFAVAVLHELETGAARFYVLATFLATAILLLVLLLM